MKTARLARARELAPGSGLSEGYLRQALHHLIKSGWLVRLRKGLYALSSSFPGATPAQEFEVAMALVDPPRSPRGCARKADSSLRSE